MNRSIWSGVVWGAVLFLSLGSAQAGVPLIALEGEGGIAFNPVAYLAGTEVKDSFIAKPRVGVWYVDLSDSSIDWTTAGIATSFGKRVELSFGFESIAVENAANVHKKTFGAKLLLVNENAGGTKWVPAISLGVKRKSTSFTAKNRNGVDFYLVATKLITQTPKPILLSFGAQSTKEQVTGIIGFNDNRKTIFFGNFDIVPTSWLGLGCEYRTGPHYSNGYKDADYFNIHAAYFVNKDLTLALAYTNAGKNTFNGHESDDKLGFGPGLVISMQYAF